MTKRARTLRSLWGSSFAVRPLKAGKSSDPLLGTSALLVVTRSYWKQVPRYLLMKAIATRLEAITTMVEAIARCPETIASEAGEVHTLERRKNRHCEKHL